MLDAPKYPWELDNWAEFGGKLWENARKGKESGCQKLSVFEVLKSRLKDEVVTKAGKKG